jgi:putative nucleotidyltransferase with HDIG domain
MPTDTAVNHVLVVDDDESFREAVRGFLQPRGYAVTTADTAQSALERAARVRIDVVLADLEVAEVSGPELIARVHAIDPLIPILVLSRANDARTVSHAFRLGVSGFISKPVSLPALESMVSRAISQLVAARRQLDNPRQALAETLRRVAELEVDQQRLREQLTGIAESLINAMEAKNVYLRGHSERVASLAASLAAEMQLDDETVENIRLAARLHDIGKIGIREHILDKPGRLTTEEYDHVKEHVRIGMEILQPLTYLGPVLEYVRDHQERPDGRGYPRQLTGEQISVGARIVGGADVFDALTSRRAHRDPLSIDNALAFLQSNVGSAIAGDVYQALHRVVREGRTLIFLQEAPRA